MDNLSHKILKYISSQEETSRAELISNFGNGAKASIDFLSENKYITSGRIPIGAGPDHRPILASDGVFRITSQGLAYLQEKPGKDFDRWLTRIVAIWGAITGTAALVIELVLHFL